MSYEQIVIVGNVGKEPEMRYTPSGVAVTSFSVAVNSQHGEDKTTKWFRVSAWGKLAEACNQYVAKGMSVLVAGTLVADAKTGAPRIWKTRTDEPQTAFDINADVVRFLGKKPKESKEHTNEAEEFPF